MGRYITIDNSFHDEMSQLSGKGEEGIENGKVYRRYGSEGIMEP